MAAKRQVEGYTIGQLEELTGVPVRTLRSWVAARVLPRPAGKGRGARYFEEHVLRAKAALQLRRKRRSLPDIRRQLLGAKSDELTALAELAPHPSSTASAPARPPLSDPSYPFSTWEVVQLVDGLTLLVNPQRGPAIRRLADEIYRHYAGPSTSKPSTPSQRS